MCWGLVFVWPASSLPCFGEIILSIMGIMSVVLLKAWSVGLGWCDDAHSPLKPSWMDRLTAVLPTIVTVVVIIVDNLISLD